MSQEARLLAFMSKHPDVGITTKGLYRLQILGNVPYTSYTRALNNLVREGHVIKTSLSVIEEFGVKNRLFVYPRSA
jgi:hypothetical protein